MKTQVSFLVLAVVAGFSGVSSAQTTEITPQEAESISYMRQEERLARDVYVRLGERWGGQPFSNITRAEEQHMNAVSDLLTRFKVDDPVAGLKEGQFKDAKLTELYGTLVQKGIATRVEALKVGALIEEMDIADLNNRLHIVKNGQIRTVLENLARGSRNHLRAFAKALKRAGGNYKSKHLTQAEFDKIANSPMERGR